MRTVATALLLLLFLSSQPGSSTAPRSQDFSGDVCEGGSRHFLCGLSGGVRVEFDTPPHTPVYQRGGTTGFERRGRECVAHVLGNSCDVTCRTSTLLCGADR